MHEELSMLGDLERQIQAITEGASPSDPSSVAAQELQALVADVEILKVEKAQIEAKAQEFSNEAIDALAQAHLVGEQRVGEAEQREQQSAEEMKNQQVRVGGHGHACTVKVWCLWYSNERGRLNGGVWGGQVEDKEEAGGL